MQGIKYDADLAIFMPLRGKGYQQLNANILLKALKDENFTVIVIDTSLDGNSCFPTVPKAIFSQFAVNQVRIATSGSVYRVNTAIVARPEFIANNSYANASIISDNSVLIIDDELSKELSMSEEENTLYSIVNILEKLRGKPYVAFTSDKSREILSADFSKFDIEVLEEEWRFEVSEKEIIRQPKRIYAGSSIPRIGRHITGNEPKWPSDDLQVRRSFPTTANWNVSIFGPHKKLVELLERVPANWNLNNTYHSGDLNHFDFWLPAIDDVEEIHADVSVRQALAAGQVVVLPAELYPYFGNAAVYATVAGSRKIINKLFSDPALYTSQSRKALQFANKYKSEKITEYLQKLGTEADQIKFIQRPKKSKPRKGRSKFRVLFITSNGAGMGHLTRLLAIARNLPENIEPIFVSLSQAVPVVKSFGFPYVYIASKNETGLPSPAWNSYAERRFTEEIKVFAPDAILFDGTWPYRGLLKAAEAENIPMVWSRRGMWKSTIADRSLTMSRYFDGIIEPGEFSAQLDQGATSRAKDSLKVNPLTILGRDELLSRAQAREKLRILDNEKAVLVTLGAGNLNNINSITEMILESLKREKTGWRIFITDNPISGEESIFEGIESLSVYPIVELANAFDFTVSASGYNSFHEWMMACVPTLWIPNLSTQTDDQATRSRFAEEAGVGISLENPSAHEIDAAIDFMTNEINLQRMKVTLEKLWVNNGANEAALALTRVIENGYL